MQGLASAFQTQDWVVLKHMWVKKQIFIHRKSSVTNPTFQFYLSICKPTLWIGLDGKMQLWFIAVFTGSSVDWLSSLWVRLLHDFFSSFSHFFSAVCPQALRFTGSCSASDVPLRSVFTNEVCFKVASSWGRYGLWWDDASRCCLVENKWFF